MVAGLVLLVVLAALVAGVWRALWCGTGVVRSALRRSGSRSRPGFRRYGRWRAVWLLGDREFEEYVAKLCRRDRHGPVLFDVDLLGVWNSGTLASLRDLDIGRSGTNRRPRPDHD